MGFFSSLFKAAAPVIGGVIGSAVAPGIGTAIGGSLGGAIAGSGGAIGTALGSGISGNIANAQAANRQLLDFNQQKQLQDEFNTFSANEALKVREFNAAEAGKSRDWQQYMSSTAHQREVHDLKTAGLNPILAAKYGGASTPSGATASGIGPSTLQTPAQTLSSVTQLRQVRAQEKRINAETDLIRSQASQTRAQTKLTGAQTGLTTKQEEALDASIANTIAQTRNVDTNTAAKRLEMDIMKEVTLPNGKLDGEKLKLVLEELKLRIEEIKANPAILRQILAQQGGHLKATHSAVKSAVETLSKTYYELFKTIKEYFGTYREQARLGQDYYLKHGKLPDMAAP